MKESYFALATAKYAAHPADIRWVNHNRSLKLSETPPTTIIYNHNSGIVLENVSTATYKLKLGADNVAGVYLPNFDQMSDNKIRK